MQRLIEHRSTTQIGSFIIYLKSFPITIQINIKVVFYSLPIHQERRLSLSLLGHSYKF